METKFSPTGVRRVTACTLLFVAAAILCVPVVVVSPPAEAAEATKDEAGGSATAGVRLSQNIDSLVSFLPILPPDRAVRPFDDTLRISGLPVGKFLSLLSRKPFLDMNLVIATNSEALDKPFDVALSDISVGELFNLILQLNGLKAMRFNENTLIIVNADDKNSYGVRRRKTYNLTYWMPSKLAELIDQNPFLKQFFEKTSFIENDVQRNLVAIGTPDELTLLDYLTNLLDVQPNKIHARIPISNIAFEDLKKFLTDMLPEDIASTLDSNRWVYSEAGRSILVYDDPATVELLKKLIANIDIPPKQVLIDIALMEVSSNFSREIGMKLGSSSFTVDSLDKLFSLSRLSAALDGSSPAQTQVSYLMQQNGGRALASPKVRCLDGESADINIGEIRNIRVQSTEFNSTTGGASQQTTFNTQEVPIGVQLTVKPEVHNDGTVTLDLNISDEAVLQIQDYGVDRTTRNSTTKLRIKDGETVIMGGFISQNRSWDKTPIPILGQLPLIGRLFRAGQRTKTDTELDFLITPYILDYEKDGTRSFATKTLGDLRKDYTQDAGATGVKTSTTRWLEDDATKTKLILDAEGKVVYKQTWSKSTGEPVGTSIDLRSEAERAADAAPPERSETPTTAAAPSLKLQPNRRMTPEEFRALMRQPLTPPADTSSELPPTDDMTAPVPTAAPPPPSAATVPPPAATAARPAATGNESWDQLLDKLDDIVAKPNGS